jgi:DNA mismatch repair protein MutS
MVKYTPMMEQYLAIKKDVTDCILFFRLGDFYEMFFEDALTASRELDITLTGREAGVEQRIPMCGVPHHAADNYMNRLVDKGYKVAICEQVENPAEAKGVVKREVVRIVTPGTQMDSKSISHAGNNYVVCLSESATHYGLAACDLTTGELSVTSFEHSADLVLDELYVYKPAELIGDDSVIQAILKIIPNGAKPLRVDSWTNIDERLFKQQFGAEQTDVLNAAAQRAVGLMITYLSETQKRSLLHIRTIRAYEPQQYLVLDPFTRRNLELTETVRDRSRAGSLLWLLDKTVTSIGARQLKRWIEKPLVSKTDIEHRLEAVQFLTTDLISREDIRTGLKEVYDLERLVGRISYGNANARDLIALQVSLQQVPSVTTICQNSDSLTLQALVSGIDECSDVLSWIQHAIDESAPVSVRDGGMIKPGYDEYLDKLREASKNGKQWMAELERTEREYTGIKSLKMGFNKVFGYYIEVTKANLSSLPEGRYERKQTLSNAERYVTPELKEKEALILEAEDKMVGLEYELFVALRDRIAEHIPRLQKLADVISTIDCLQSLAEVSAARQYQCPQLTEGYDLIIDEGRHAVVEAVLKDERFVSNGTKLVEEASSMLLITGPNMAGKSTYMRQVAIICIMAQVGCFVPAAYAEIPIIDRIFTRIGAADDLIGGQSTFMVEMMDIRVMTEKATKRSLVIIDELGRGTSTNEGMAIAQAVIEFLHDQVGCKTLVSTHFHELAHLETSLPSLWNGRMAVKESGNDVSFLRKLVEGAAGTSYGIYCAQIAGLPQSIIERSYDLLQVLEVQHVTSLETAVSKKPSPQVEQLSLFDPEAKDMKPIIDRLNKADLMNMTPIQAMQLIDELKQLVKT